MTNADDAVRLACGADVDELLEQVAEGRGSQRDAHQGQCVHCQAAITELSTRWEPVAAATRHAPQPPAELSSLVMQSIGRLVKDVWYTLQLTEHGTISVAARVVAKLARDAARRVPGVRVALGRSTESRLAAIVERATLRHRHPHAAVGVLGRTAVVELALAVEYGPAVHEVALAVRNEVSAELRRNLELDSVVVNVTVDDVSTE